MRDSPFDKPQQPLAPVTSTTTRSPFDKPQPVSQMLVPAAPQSIFDGKASKAMPVIPYTTDDIDLIGKDQESRLSDLSKRVTQKMTLNRMGDIGVLLADVQREVKNLDPGDLVNQDSGVIGWFKTKFTDIRKELTMRFQTADGAFSKLRDGMNQHVMRLSEWEKDDADMYMQNYERFKDILASLAQIDGIIAQLKSAEAVWPTVDASDPEAMMKAQQKFVLQDLISRASARRESILRSKVKCELNSPEILAMKSASGKLIAKLRANANDVIPEIEREIAKQIQRLNMQDAVSATTSFKDFANAILSRGAQSTKETVLQANQAFNEATLTVETISTMQNSVRDMVIGIQSISIEAEKRRAVEEAAINKNQQQLLVDLQRRGAV